jgi:hypothetical protein
VKNHQPQQQQGDRRRESTTADQGLERRVSTRHHPRDRARCSPRKKSFHRNPYDTAQGYGPPQTVSARPTFHSRRHSSDLANALNRDCAYCRRPAVSLVRRSEQGLGDTAVDQKSFHRKPHDTAQGYGPKQRVSAHPTPRRHRRTLRRRARSPDFGNTFQQRLNMLAVANRHCRRREVNTCSGLKWCSWIA